MASAPPDPPLTDGVVLLRQWTDDDVPALVAACRDPEIPKWIPMVPSPYTERDAREYVAASASGWRDGKNRNFAIVDAERRRVLGAVGFSFSAHDPGRATVGYWLAREARGRGAATRALRLAVRWAFAARRVERVELMAEPENEPSCRVAERSGFAREGVLRRYLPTRRGRRDVVIFSLLRDELRD